MAWNTRICVVPASLAATAPTSGLRKIARDRVRLVVDVVVVPLHRSVRRLPVGQVRRPLRQRAVPVPGVELVAGLDERVDLVVAEQLAGQVPAVLLVVLDFGVRGQQVEFGRASA